MFVVNDFEFILNALKKFKFARLWVFAATHDRLSVCIQDSDRNCYYLNFVHCENIKVKTHWKIENASIESITIHDMQYYSYKDSIVEVECSEISIQDYNPEIPIPNYKGGPHGPHGFCVVRAGSGIYSPDG